MTGETIRPASGRSGDPWMSRRRDGEGETPDWRTVMPRKLAPKLIVYLTLIVIVVHGTSALITLDIHQRQLRQEMILGADQISGTITHGTWQAMLADRREDAYQMMRNIGRQAGIERIRIFNREGRVMFSTGPDAGTMVDKNAEACYLCHAQSRPLVRVDVPSRVRIFRRPSGGRVMGMVTPIYNEAACYEAECHAHPRELQVLGVIDVDMSLARVDREMAAARVRALGVAVMTMLLTGTFIALFVRRFVGRPIRRLIEATQAVSRMNLDQAVDVHTGDEVGELARSFDLMRQRLQQRGGGEPASSPRSWSRRWSSGRRSSKRPGRTSCARTASPRSGRSPPPWPTRSTTRSRGCATWPC